MNNLSNLFPGFIFLTADSGGAAIMNGLVGGLILSLIVWLIQKSRAKGIERTNQNDLNNAELHLANNPNDFNALFLIAKENYKKGNTEKALEQFNKCVTLNPNKEDYLMFLAIIYHTWQNYSQVLYLSDRFCYILNASPNYMNQLNSIVKLYPKTFPFFWYIYGYALTKSGDNTLAQEVKNSAIKWDATLKHNRLY